MSSDGPKITRHWVEMLNVSTNMLHYDDVWRLSDEHVLLCSMR